jgi:hypothetical protein
MGYNVPRNNQARDNEEAASVIFIGPSSSGKTTSLILLHQTLIDYSKDLNCTYTPSIKSEGFQIYKEANNLMLNGKSPPPTPPSIKDVKIELHVKFKGNLLRKPKFVKLLFADMSGEISSKLMSIFPQLINSTPTQVRQQLMETGINPDDVEYLIHTLLSSKGIILVADASKIDDPNDSPDYALATYLDNLNQYAIAHGEKPKGFALLLTKFDALSNNPAYQNPKDDALKELVANFLSQVNNFATAFNQNNGTSFKIFYSMLKATGQVDDRGMPLFTVEARNARNQTRAIYSVAQYRHLIEWLRDTFGN